MEDSVYKVITLIGTSTESWEKAAAAAVARASESLQELRVAEVLEQDMVIEGGRITAYRTKLRLSFKYLGDIDDDDEEKDEGKIENATGLEMKQQQAQKGKKK